MDILWSCVISTAPREPWEPGLASESDDLSAQKSASRIGMVGKYIIHRFHWQLICFCLQHLLWCQYSNVCMQTSIDVQHFHVYFIILGHQQNENINKYCIHYRKNLLHLFQQIVPLCFAALPISSNTSRIELGSLTSKNLNANLHIELMSLGFESAIPGSQSFLKAFCVFWSTDPLGDIFLSDWTVPCLTDDQINGLCAIREPLIKIPKSILQIAVYQINVFCNPFDQIPKSCGSSPTLSPSSLWGSHWDSCPSPVGSTHLATGKVAVVHSNSQTHRTTWTINNHNSKIASYCIFPSFWDLV